MKLEEICSYLPWNVRFQREIITTYGGINDHSGGKRGDIAYISKRKGKLLALNGEKVITKTGSFYLNKPCFVKVDTWVTNNVSFKLILHPTSDITKPIEHNGEKFVPIVELAKILFPFVGNWGKWEYIGENKSEKVYELQIQYKSKSNDISPYHQFVIPIEPDKMSWKIVQKLHEWHFWLGDQSRFGKDIIDINTLNE